jgi:hypothetical protein
LVIEDPNYPEEKTMDPDLSALKSEVFARIATQRSQDEAKKGKDGSVPRTFYRFTDWSTATAPTYADFPGEYEMGSVTASRTVTVTVDPAKKTTVEVETSQRGAVGNIVFADWDANLGIDIPTEHEVQKGSLFYFGTKDKEPEVVDPVSKSIKKVKGYKLSEVAAVVDVRGGENLGHNNDRGDKLATAGEMLVFRPDGSLVVCNELDDQMSFRMFTFADEKEQADGGGSGSGGGMMGGPGASGPGASGGPGGAGPGSSGGGDNNSGAAGF